MPYGWEEREAEEQRQVGESRPSRQSRSKALLAAMTKDELRFSYGALLSVEAHRQLGRQCDGNTRTVMVAIQKDVDAVKADILQAANIVLTNTDRE